MSDVSFKTIKIDRVNEVLFLGVILDEYSSRKSQIQNVARKLYKTIGTFYKSSYCLNKTSLRTLYYSLVYSYLLYRQECFTGKYTTRKIHKNYTRDPSALFSIISHVSLSMT